jgi:predicted RND superfamily exporter protein
MGAGEAVQKILSRTMRASARHAWAVVGVVVLITVGALAVLITVEPNVETDVQSGYFGKNDEQANFFRELREKVAGVNSEIVYFELAADARGPDPNTGEVRDVDDVTDMISLRAQEELFAYVKSEFVERTAALGLNGGQGVDKVISHTSLPYFYKLIYKQFPSLDDSDGCFCLPPTPIEHEITGELLRQADSTGAVALYHDEQFQSAVMFIIYDPDTSVISKKETGGLINEIIEDYRALAAAEDGPKRYDLWREEYLDSWGVQSWIYRIDEQVAEESQIFVAAVFVFLAAALLVLFRNVKRAVIGVLTVAIILLWTLAGMTVGGVSIGFVSMAMFPLLLGVGVDYVIHIVNEFGTERSHVETSAEAFDLIGRRGAVALMISTLTTISGFVVMIMSTSPMIVEISTATILGIVSIFTLSVTWLPAMLELSVRNESREVFRPSVAIGNTMVFFGRHKAVTIVGLVVMTGALAYWIPKTEYVIGTVEINLPQKELWTHEEDRAHMLDMYERFQTQIKASGQETVITKARDECGQASPTQPCGLATRAAVHDMIAIHKNMQADPFVQQAGGAVNSVPFILNLYALLQDGVVSALPGITQNVLLGGAFLPCDDLPQIPCGVQADTWDDDFGLILSWDDDQVLAAYNDMIDREEWKPLLLTFMDEQYSIAWALTFVNLEIDAEATVKMDEAFAAVIENAAPTATDNQYFGTLTGVKKYNDYTNTWLTLSTIASVSIVALLVFIFTRSLRAVAATVTPMVLSLVWWLGALPTPVVDIDLAFIFMIPIAFITSLGSDYAVHLTWNLEQQNNPKFVFMTVGKAVAYSGFTTFVAFYIFTRGAIRGSYEMFEAAVLAIAIMTVLTLVTIPLFYWRPGRDSAEATPAPTSARTPMATPAPSSAAPPAPTSTATRAAAGGQSATPTAAPTATPTAAPRATRTATPTRATAPADRRAPEETP